ncbi:MAG TPA: right-handed parallel beta-helix repeat-containing protein [Bacteroidales bacterium]|nr:right-handed parallel beta-helix repeat-containing protein [Bacteroidales bacterium]
MKELLHQGTGEPASEKIGSYLQHLYDNPVFNREAGTNNGIVNCTIYNTGAGGIHLSGGDRLTLKPGNNYVENCVIHNFNRIEKSYRAGIDISGVGNRISHCEMYNAPSMAILLHGNDHLIEYNEIHHVCREVHDQGAIFYKVEKIVNGKKEWLPFKDDNWITDEDPGFVNPEEMNFELKEDAKAFEKIPGFEPIPFSQIGVQNNFLN